MAAGEPEIAWACLKLFLWWVLRSLEFSHPKITPKALLRIVFSLFSSISCDCMEGINWPWITANVYRVVGNFADIILIFAIFPAIRKYKFVQIKITANIFPLKVSPE